MMNAPFLFLVSVLAGWLNQHQQLIIDYLVKENAVLREQLDGNRASRMLNDGDWPGRQKGLGGKYLAEIKPGIIFFSNVGIIINE